MQQAQNPWEMDFTQEDSAPWEMDFEPPRPEPSSILRRAGDVGISALKGAIGLPESFVGMADLVSNGQVGKAVEDAGVRFKDAKGYLDQFYSPEQQRANREVQEADGFFPTVGAMVRNPSTIVNAAVESAPSVLGGWGVSRGLMGAAPKISGTLAGAIGEGATAAGQNAEQVRQESTDGLLTPEQSGILAASGALTGAIGYGAGRLANRLGVGDIDTLGLQRNATAESAQKAAEKGLLRRIGEGALTEGVLEELPQSYQEQVAQNLAQDKPWDEGAAKAAAQGMMAGALMGAGAGPFHGGQHEAPPQQETPPPQQEVPPTPQTLQLERNPDAGQMVVFKDGTIAYRSDFENALAGMPDDKRAATLARVMGFAPQQAVPNPAAQVGSLSAAANVAVVNGAHDVEVANAAIAQQQEAADQKPEPITQAAAESTNEDPFGFDQLLAEREAQRTATLAQDAPGDTVDAAEWDQTPNTSYGADTADAPAQEYADRMRNAQGADSFEPSGPALPSEELLQPEYDSLPIEQKAEVLQQVPRLVADSGDLNVIGKAMLDRPLEQMPPAVQQAVEQVLTPQQQDDATLQGMTPEQRKRSILEREIATGTTDIGGVQVELRPSQILQRKQQLKEMDGPGKIEKTPDEAPQPPASQQVEPTYPAQRTTLDASPQNAIAGPVYDAQAIEAMLPAKPAMSVPDRLREQRAAEENKSADQQVEQQAEGSEAPQEQQAATPNVDQPGTNQQALDRIAAGKAWFGNELKAKNWLHTNGLAETHEVKMTQPRRFEIVAKAQQPATQQQAGVSPESVVSEQDLAAFNENIKAVRDESFGEPKRKQSVDGATPANTLSVPDKLRAQKEVASTQSAPTADAATAAGFTHLAKDRQWSKTVAIAENRSELFNIREVPLGYRVSSSATFPGTGITGAPSVYIGTFKTLEDAVAATQIRGANAKSARFSSSGGGRSEVEKELLALSHKDERDGDVLMSNGSFAPFDAVVERAREGIASGSFIPAPAQLHFNLDMSMRDADRVLKAALAAQQPAETSAPAPAPKDTKPVSVLDKLQAYRKDESTWTSMTISEREALIARSGDPRWTGPDGKPSIQAIRLAEKRWGNIPAGDLDKLRAAMQQPSAVDKAAPQRGTVGMKLASGQVVTTQTGRTTTPFPTIQTGTSRKSENTQKAVDRWLISNALAEAQSRGDTFNERQFQAVNNLNVSQADKDSAEEYLFGNYVPANRPSILNPLTSTATQAASDAKARKAAAMREKADRIEAAGGDKQVVQSLRDQAMRDAPVSTKVKVGDKLIWNAGFSAYVKPDEVLTVVGMTSDNSHAHLSNGRMTEVSAIGTTWLKVDTSTNTLENVQNNADTEIKKEAQNDPAKQGSTPTLNHPLDEGQQPAGSQSPARGARQARAGEGRLDDGSVRRGGQPNNLGSKSDQEGIGDGSVRAGGEHGETGSVARDSGRHASDFVPAIGGLTREGSWFDTAKRNIDLIELAIKIESENRPATPEEQAQLSKYVGFGAGAIRNELFPVPSEYAKRQEPNRLIWPNFVRNARFKPLAERIEALPREWQQSILQSSQYAHYTSEGIIRSVWSGLQRLGFTGGNVFEPGMGIGSFAMLMPNTVRQTSRYTGVEFDAPTALIARLLSPQQNMLHGDFIKRKFPQNFFDVNVGNPPFSQTKIFGDPQYEKHGFMLHDFFFAKGIDLVRPGGIQVFVTSKGTMDKQNDKARKYLSDRADLLGAVRLPSTAFEDNAGTSVVTDVIFLRKRAPGEEPSGHAWGSVTTVDTKDGPVVVNEYFAAHPEMVLGQQRISGNVDDMGRRISSNGFGGEKYTVVSYDSTPAELDAKFAKAIENLPENAYSVMNQSPDAIKAEAAKIDFDPSIKREGVVYLAKDGSLMKVENGVGKPLADTLKLSAKDAAWFKSYVGLRDLVQEARFSQVNDGNWETSLKKLNKAYDAFRKQHGPIKDYRTITRKSTDEEGNVVESQTRIFKNQSLWREDYDSSLITALEAITEDGSIVKTPFLLGRTIGKPVTREVKTIGDALAVSLDETGMLNLDDVANRMHISRDEAIDALGNQIYQAPNGEWQLADEYLSGNVVQKLDEAEEAARLKPELRRNVEALKQAQPEKLGPSKISAKLGSSWIPVEHVNEFSTEIDAGNVTFDPKTETWQVEGGNLRSQRKASAEYGTADRSPSELLEAVLNSRPIKITAKTADGKTVTNNEATTAANEAAKKIKDKFKGWVWTDTNRASELVEIYNRRYNNIAPRKFDGSHLTLPGVSLRYKLHPHQLRAIWRIIQTGNTYLAHAVGAGKTIEMIAAGMEQKRLGLVKKPMYVVPNHMLEQFSNEFMDLYPLANIMVADDQNFSADKRKAFIASATLNNPDAIIITHDAFQRIGVKEESIAPIRDEILTDLELELSSMAKDQGARVRRSQLEQQIEAVKQRFDRILGAGGKDATIKFEDMGVDFVFVDEAHAMRKLDFQTSQQIKGIDPNGSKRALDMYIKTRILDKKNPGRSMVFASGTPVTNTMGELYTIMRFFAAHQMDVDGISTFDAWSRQFGEVAPALEPNAAGKYEMVERFAKFDNVPELMSRVRQFMDVLTSDNLGALIKRPDLVGGKPNMNIISMSQSLKSYMQNVLAPRIEVSKKWKPTRDEPFNTDPILKIISDGRFAAIDPRFFGGALQEGETSIINEMGDKITANYHATKDNVYLDKDGKPEPVKGSTQIVFYNNGYGASAKENRGFDARAALTKRLTAGGIPRNEIAWFDDADTDAKKEAIFKDMRSGKLKVLIGSAKKMGTGVNVQKRLAVLHYQDPPWYPADVEQPHGRIIRQGNQNPEVKIEWYTTKGTYQSTMWQMVGRKQRFIDQAFSGDKNLRSMEDMGEASLFEQAAAVASGDPRAIQLAGLRQDVERFERLQAAHANEQIRVRSSLRSQEWNVKALNNRINTLSKAFKAIGEKFFSFADTNGKVAGVEYSKPMDFGQALKDAFNKVAADSLMDGGNLVADKKIATLGGAVTVTMDSSLDKNDRPDGSFYLMVNVGETSLQVAHSVSMGADVDAAGLARRVFNQINSIDSDLRKARMELTDAETEITKLRKKSGAPFEYQQEMVEKYAELKRLEEELRSEGEAIQNQPTNVAINADGEIITGKQASEGDGKPAVYSHGAGPGISHGELAHVVEDFLSQFTHQAPVRILDSAVGVLPGVNNGDGISGAVHRGRIHLFLEHIPGRIEAVKTLWHEMLHYGLRRFLTRDQYIAEMLDLYKKDMWVRGNANKWLATEEGKDAAAYGGADYARARGVDEALAQLSEDTQGGKESNAFKANAFRRVVSWLARLADKWLKKYPSVAAYLRGMTNEEAKAYVRGVFSRLGSDDKAAVDDWAFTADPAFKNSTFTTTANKAANTLSSFATHPGTVSGWWKTVGSMYGLAQKNPEFKPVFEAGQRFLNDVSYYATEAANLAPTLLPKLESIRDMFKAAIPHSDNKLLADALFQGTLSWKRDAAGKLEKTDNIDDAGVVFTAAELKSTFGMNDRQVGLYHEARAAIDNSLDNTAKAAMVQLGGKQLAHMREMVMAAPSASDAANLLAQEIESMTEEDPDLAGALDKAASDIKAVADKITGLKDNGYAPLSRFGRYTVDVVANGKREYFGLFESKRDANLMAEKMRSLHSGATIEQGTLSQKEFEMFQGITPETAELFGDMLGVDQTEAFQEYLRLVKNNRSAMKRLIHRKGIAGYNDDVGRVLSAFIASNSRKGSSDLNLGDMTLAVSSIPKNQGELKDIAISLQKYLTNPQEEAPAMRGMLFAQYIGGSVASAMVNLTQPMQVSMPYLSQFGGAKKATGALWGAYRDMANKGYKYPPALESALRVAEEQGIIAPQEIHQLQAQARGAATLRSGDGTPIGEAIAMGRNHFTRLMLGWGKLFGLAEQVNRRATFVAAYRLAQQQGIANPAAFAAKAVHETQFVNNKGNRMHFGRGPIGSVAMTFKSYGLNYLELLHRMATQNGTEGKQAAALMLGMLVLMAGAGGLPFEDDLMDVVDALAQRLGYNFSSKKAKQQFLEETFGKAAADFIDKGITGLPGMPIDVSLRMGMGNMIPGTGLLLQKKDHSRDLRELAGPAGDFGKRLFDAAGNMADGKVGNAVATAMPKAVGNVVQGASMLNKGYYSDTEGRKVIDTTPSEAVAKMIGFQPESVASDSDAAGLVQRMKDVRSINSEKFSEMWAKGLYEKDQQQVQEARDAIKSWNEKNPDTRIMPNIPAILRRVREMRKTRDQRIIDSSPKAMRAGIRRELAEARS